MMRQKKHGRRDDRAGRTGETDMVSSHGRFVWYELTTTDMEAAKAFYAEVVGWGTRDASMPGLPYTVFTAGEASVGGMMDLPKDARDMGERPSWIGYVGVNDVDATADRIKQLGGAVHVQPPAQQQPPAQEQPIDFRTPGRVGWHELFAADWEKAWPFYSELFGWQKAEVETDATGTYQLFSAAGQTIGGMTTKPPMMRVPFWLYYFNVGDIDAAVKRVKAGGGQVLSRPTRAPKGNVIVQCTDPQGALFALVGHNGIGYFERVGTPRAQSR
jgi:predicted enzyme related to lactoylglutathione lyase